MAGNGVAGANRIGRILQVFAPLVVVGYGLWSVLTLRGLIADGSWTFFRALTEGGYWAIDPYRLVGGSLGQTTLALSLAIGIHDLRALAYLHTLSYVLVPTLCWASAMWISRREAFWPLIVLGYAATMLTSGMVAVADSNLLFALTALSFTATARYFRHGGRGWPWVVLACSVVMTTTHGLAVLLGPFLIATIILLHRRHHRRLDVRWILVLACQGIATIVGAVAIIRPYSAYNVVAASDLGTPLQNPQLRFLAVWLLLLVVPLVATSTVIRMAAGAMLLAALVWFVVDPSLWATPLQQHSSRTISGLILFLLLCVALIVDLRDSGGAEGSGRGILFPLLACALVLAFVVPSAWHASNFRSYLQDFSRVVNAQTGLITHEDFVKEVPAAATYGWPFTFPATSWLLGGSGPHAYVLNPADSIYLDLFDPADPPTRPPRFTGSVVGG